MEQRHLLSAQTITVDTFEDVTNLADGLTSLREAVAEADTGDTIEFARELYGGAVTLEAELQIADDIDIVGPGSEWLAIESDGTHRLFSVSGDVEIRELTLQGGGGVQQGGGISNSGTLTLDSVVVQGNQATSAGGGIHSTGQLILLDSVVRDNVANYGGGIQQVGGSLYVSSSAIVKNENHEGAASSRGGGVDVVAATASGYGFTLLNSTIGENQARGGGGVALVNGTTAKIVNATIAENSAHGDGQNFGGGGLLISNAATDSVVLQNTILAKNYDTYASTSARQDLYGWYAGGETSPAFNATSTHNLVGVGYSQLGLNVANNQVGSAGNGNEIDPGLLSLAADGTDVLPIFAIDPLANSLAVDAGSNANAQGTKDQYGNNRLITRDLALVLNSGDYVDIGAHELGLVVSTDSDVADGNDYSHGNLSLREAIDLAHALDGPDLIEFDDALTGTNIELSEQLVLDDTNGTVTISGPDKTPGVTRYVGITGNGSRVIEVSASAQVELHHLRIEGGGGVQHGGGISNSGTLTLNSVDILGNQATSSGGGVYSTGQLVVLNSSLVVNTANYGGGIQQVGGSLYVSGSSIVGNTYHQGAQSSRGGGVDVVAASASGYGFTLLNSTIGRNKAHGGGGVALVNGTTAKIVNATIAENSAVGTLQNDGGGGLLISNAATDSVVLQNTIVAKNSDADTPAHQDLFGWYAGGATSPAFTATSTHNLVGANVPLLGLNAGNNQVGSAGNDNEINPGLLSLAAYEGSYFHFPIDALENSLAVDAGSDAHAIAIDLTSDQRGPHFRRHLHDHTDIGAVESVLVREDTTSIVVYGTDRADSITLQTDPEKGTSTLSISGLGLLLDFDPAVDPINLLEVHSLGGDDEVLQFPLGPYNGLLVTYGGSGDDTLHGGIGRDEIFGGPGFDIAYPGEGDDLVEEVKLPAANDTSAAIDSEYVLQIDWTGVDSSVTVARIDWGDGGPPTTVAHPVAADLTTVSHTYLGGTWANPENPFRIQATYEWQGDLVASDPIELQVLFATAHVPYDFATRYMAETEDVHDLTLSWHHTTFDPDQYEIQRSIDGLDSSTNWRGLGVNDQPGSSTMVNGEDSEFLIPIAQQPHYYRIRTIKDGMPSDWAYARPAPGGSGVVAATAEVSTAGSPHVELSWPDERYLNEEPANITYTIFRKLLESTDWGAPIATGSEADFQLSFVDATVSVGQQYDYRIERTGGLLPNATGIVSVAVESPATDHEDRGTALLLIDSRHVEPLAFELARLVEDLIGDGWKVEQEIVDVTKSPQAVRADYIQPHVIVPNNDVRSVLLIGRIPVAQTGWLAPDGHGIRPASTDAYYGDLDVALWTDNTVDETTDVEEITIFSNIPDDGILDPGSGDIAGIPGDGLELAVGRIDMHDMTAFDPVSTYNPAVPGDWQRYTIPVGQLMPAGDYDYLTLVSGALWGHAATDPSNRPNIGVSQFRNLILHTGDVQSPVVDLSDPDVLDDLAVLRAREQLGFSKDGVDGKEILGQKLESPGEVTHSNGSLPDGVIQLDGNAWKVLKLPGQAFPIGPDSILEVEFRPQDGTNGVDLSQVVAVGFDMDGADQGPHEVISEGLTFRLHAETDRGWGSAIDPSLETELLRRYLNKDHAYRHKQFLVEERALVDESRSTLAPFAWNEAVSYVGKDNIEARYGENGVWERELEDSAGYMWGFVGTGGTYWSAGAARTSTYASQPMNAVFSRLTGSYSMDFNRTDSLLRAVLANEGYGLASLWGGREGGRPPTFYHMGVGKPVGEAYLDGKNGGDLYDGDAVNQVYQSLLGDPTLRMHVVAPASNVQAESATGGGVEVSWTDSNDTGVVGYHVYRSVAGGPYLRDDISSGETGVVSGYVVSNGSVSDDYMVRAVKLEVTPSGSYYNLSQGAFSNGIKRIAAVNQGSGQGEPLAESYDGLFNLDILAPSQFSINTNDAIDLSRSPSVPIGTPETLFQSAAIQLTTLNTPLIHFYNVQAGQQFAIRLFFAEFSDATHPIVDEPGERVFDVVLAGVDSGSFKIEDIDIFAEVGANAGLVKTAVVTAISDFVYVTTDAVSGLPPVISAIEIFQL